jgi:hypothetical protein
MLVIPTISGEILGVDAATGAVRWQFQSPGTRNGNVSVRDGRLWLMQENAQIFVIACDSGRLIARLTSVNQNVGAPGHHYRILLDEQGAFVPMGLIHMRLDYPR